MLVEGICHKAHALARIAGVDNCTAVYKDQNIPVLVVNNKADGEEHLKKQVEELFKNLF